MVKFEGWRGIEQDRDMRSSLGASAIRMTMTHLQTIKPACRLCENESYG